MDGNDCRRFHWVWCFSTSNADSFLNDTNNWVGLKNFILHLKDINGIEYYGIGMASSSISYICVSLLTFKKKWIWINF